MARRGWGSIAERDGQFYGRFRLNGAPTMRLLKSTDGAPVRTLKQAEAALGRLRKSVEDGGLRSRRASPTFRAWCASEYLPVLVLRVAKSSLRSEGTHLEKLAGWIETHDVPRTMDGFTKRHADQFVTYLLAEDGCKPSYAARLTRTLRAAWRTAASHGAVLDGSVWDKVRVRVGAAPEVPWISPEQLVSLYDAVVESQRDVVTLIGETGLRVGEALALRWPDVDLGERPSVFVREGKTKAARRKIPLSPRAVAALAGIARDEGQSLVFPPTTVHGPRTSQGIRQAIRRACKAANLPTLKTHSLRHVLASHLVQSGLPAPTVARLLGHADHGVLVTELYGRWMPESAGEAAMDHLQAWRAAGTPQGRPASEGTSLAGSTSPGTQADPAGPPAPATNGAGS